MLTVEKIGGTSMSRFKDVLQNIIIGNRSDFELYNRVFVVSACSMSLLRVASEWSLPLEGLSVTQPQRGFIKNSTQPQRCLMEHKTRRIFFEVSIWFL